VSAARSVDATTTEVFRTTAAPSLAIAGCQQCPVGCRANRGDNAPSIPRVTPTSVIVPRLRQKGTWYTRDVVTVADLRRRVDGWRQAERREQSLRAEAGPLTPAESFRAALELFDLLPIDIQTSDVTREHEVASARRAWRTLRIRLIR
jgi:hypothetical protein